MPRLHNSAGSRTLDRLLAENLDECAHITEMAPGCRERAFRNVRLFAIVHALERGLPISQARHIGAVFEALSRDMVTVLTLGRG